jgi:hypothetical protein
MIQLHCRPKAPIRAGTQRASCFLANLAASLASAHNDKGSHCAWRLGNTRTLYSAYDEAAASEDELDHVEEPFGAKQRRAAFNYSRILDLPMDILSVSCRSRPFAYLQTLNTAIRHDLELAPSKKPGSNLHEQQEDVQLPH